MSKTALQRFRHDVPTVQTRVELFDYNILFNRDIDMKKTFICLAAIAASGAAMAQVSITGTLASGYRSGTYLTTPAGVRFDNLAGAGRTNTAAAAGTTTDSSGLGVDTSEINFGFSEDLGGGMRIKGTLGLSGADRSGANVINSYTGVTSAATSGGDTSLSLTMGAGTLTLVTALFPDYVTGSLGGTAAVGGVDMSNKITLPRAARDGVMFTFAPVAGFIPQVFQVEANALPGLAYPSPGGVPLGLGVGSAGAATAINQRQTGVGLTYVNGPLMVNAQFVSADNRYDGQNTSVKDVQRLSGNYNFGAVKVGAALEVDNTMTGAQLQMANYVVAVPFGALKLSANYTTWNLTGMTNAVQVGAGPAALKNGTKTGAGIAADYALSKSTHIIANYASWEYVVGAGARSSETNLLLSYAF